MTLGTFRQTVLPKSEPTGHEASSLLQAALDVEYEARSDRTSKN